MRGKLRHGRSASAQWAPAVVAGVALYAAIDVALVFLRPRFSVLHNAESDYGSNGPYAWLMDLNFVLRCLLSLAAVRALSAAAGGQRRLRVGLVAIAVWAIASGLLAVFPDDPVGTRTHGLARVHLALAAVAFVGVVVGTRLVTRALRTEPGWRPVMAPLTILSWGALVPILLLGHSRLRPHSLGGLYEKIFLAMELLWFAVAGAWAARRARTAESPAAAPVGEPRLQPEL